MLPFLVKATPAGERKWRPDCPCYHGTRPPRCLQANLDDLDDFATRHRPLESILIAENYEALTASLELGREGREA